MSTLSVDSLVARLRDRGRAAWRSLLVFGLVGGVAGIGGSYLISPVFQSTATFQAESPPGLQLQGMLAGLTSQLGNLPLAGGTTVNAQFFGDILPSDAVLRRVVRDSFPWKGARTTLDVIYGVEDKPSPMKEFVVVNRLRRSLQTSVNSRTNMVRFTVEAGSPELARALAEAILVALNEVNIDLRQTRAGAEQTFTASRAEEARRDLDNAEEALTRFYQRNRSITGSPALVTEEGRLRRAVDMSQTIYTQLRLQQEQAAVQAVRNTPAISVVDPPLEPVRKSKPKRQLAALFGLFAGLCLGGLKIVIDPNAH
jgi:uncharacterized protein involved in exopolysaccharide biosynthesis